MNELKNAPSLNPDFGWGRIILFVPGITRPHLLLAPYTLLVMTWQYEIEKTLMAHSTQ